MSVCGQVQLYVRQATHRVLCRACWRPERRWPRSWYEGQAPEGQAAAHAATCALAWTVAAYRPELHTGPLLTASAAAKYPHRATRGHDQTSRSICLQRQIFIQWTEQSKHIGGCFILFWGHTDIALLNVQIDLVVIVCKSEIQTKLSVDIPN